MTERKKPSIPFVSLHSHDTMSVYDGFGYPEDHINFSYENGLDGIAFTNHGNANSLSYAFAKSKIMKSEGKTDFKVMFGVEAYIHPDISSWKQEYTKHKEDIKLSKEIDDDTGTIVEDEKETKKNIKSTLNKRGHLVLVAQNQIGLNNIYKLISESYTGDNFYRYPRMDFKLLKQYNEGIIASSACLGSSLAQDMWENLEKGNEAVLNSMGKTVESLIDIFGDRFYGELQWANYKEQHIYNQFIIELSKRYGFELVSTVDSHFPRPDLWKDREIYKMLGWMGKRKDEIKIDALPKTLQEMEYQLYPKNGDELYASYKHFSDGLGFSYNDKLIEESIIRTAEIAKNRIENFVPDTTIKLPSFVVPDGITADAALAKMAVENLKLSGLYKDQEYVDRLKMELHTIKDRNFSKYFLTMKKVVDEAKQLQLCGSGRGSAAGSLLSYLLNITEVDPIKYKLQFQRFLRSTSVDMPDIDFDLSDPQEFKQYLADKWGRNKVVPISNYNTLQLRSLIKDLGKLYEVPFQEVNDVTSKMLNEAIPECKKEHGITAGVYNPTYEELLKYSPTLIEFLKKYPQISESVKNLQSNVRSVSVHAGGVVIADDLDKHLPLISRDGKYQTPWTEGQTVRHLEPNGFVKFDLLGLSTLRMIETCIKHILKRKHGINDPTFADIKKYYDDNLNANKIDLNDQNVYKNVFHNANFIGIFQFTNSNAQKFCSDAKPKNIIDLSAITSIYRPGPLSANVDKKYIEAKNDPSSIKYLHPLVEEVTRDTFGMLVFQEQISFLSHKLGKDISLDEGNELRKVLTKKGTGKEAEVKQKLYSKFIDGCLEKGLTLSDAESLWKNMEFFSGYGFNLAHAVCYSVISYQCAWLFNYYPSEWVCSFLDKEPEDRKESAIAMAKSYGFNIKKLDINNSGISWEVDPNDSKTLIQPLTSIKGLGETAINEIVTNRPFKNIEDVLFNVKIKYNKLNKKALDALTRTEAMNCLVDSRFTGLKHFWSAAVVDRPKTLKKFQENIEKYRPEGDFSDEEKIDNMVSLSGIYPIHLVLDPQILKRLEEKNIPQISDHQQELGDAVWFITRSVEEKKTANGKIYWILTVTDMTNQLTTIKCWGIDPKKDNLWMNRPYLAKLQKDNWGFSTRSLKHNFRLLG